MHIELFDEIIRVQHHKAGEPVYLRYGRWSRRSKNYANGQHEIGDYAGTVAALLEAAMRDSLLFASCKRG